MSKVINIKLKFIWMLRWMIILNCPLLFSQQEASFSQYMFNQQLINPAYVGAQSYTQLSILNHSQWLNIEGAPETQALSVGTKLSKKIGIGFSAFNDRIGPARNTSSSIETTGGFYARGATRTISVITRRTVIVDCHTIVK